MQLPRQWSFTLHYRYISAVIFSCLYLFRTKNVRSDQAAYNRVVTSACEVVYVIAESLKEGDQKKVDEPFEFERNLDGLTG